MNKVVVVGASWCTQCGPYKAALERAGVVYESADLEDSMALMEEYGLRGLPATFVYDEAGAIVDYFTGADVQRVLGAFK